MLTKKHFQVHRQWTMGKINLISLARKLGYKKASLSKGVTRVRTLLGEMGITVL